MFNPDNLDRLAVESAFQRFRYVTDDTLSEVLQNGYFSLDKFVIDDNKPTIIEVLASDSSAILSVDDSSGDVSIILSGALTLSADNGSGWAQYNDEQYTSGSPFTVTSGTTVALPNNAASSITDQLPVDATTFYDGTKFTAVTSGDAYIWSVRFKVMPATNNASVFCDIDIGGSQGVILSDSRRLPRGTGEENPINFTFSGYSKDTFIANGGEVQVTAEDGNLDIYDISYVITRTHKAK